MKEGYHEGAPFLINKRAVRIIQEFFLVNNIEFELKVILFSYLFSLSMLSTLCVREKKSSTARMIIISQYEMWAVENTVILYI